MGAPAARPPATHVVLGDDGLLLCQYCGSRYHMNMPCPLEVFTAAIAAYADIHAGCPKPITEETHENHHPR